MPQHEALHGPDIAISAGLDSPATSAVDVSRGDRLEAARTADRLWREQHKLDLAREIRRVTWLHIPFSTLVIATAAWLVCMGFDHFVLQGKGFIYRTTGAPNTPGAYLPVVVSIAVYFLGIGLGSNLVLRRILRWRECLVRELAEYEDPEEAAES